MERSEITEFTARIVEAGLRTQPASACPGVVYLALDHQTVRRVVLSDVATLIPVGTTLRFYVETTNGRPLGVYEGADIAQVDILGADGTITFQIFRRKWALEEFQSKTGFKTV